MFCAMDPAALDLAGFSLGNGDARCSLALDSAVGGSDCGPAYAAILVRLAATVCDDGIRPVRGCICSGKLLARFLCRLR